MFVPLATTADTVMVLAEGPAELPPWAAIASPAAKVPDQGMLNVPLEATVPVAMPAPPFWVMTTVSPGLPVPVKSWVPVPALIGPLTEGAAGVCVGETLGVGDAVDEGEAVAEGVSVALWVEL
jgi:hypothetical protein